MHKEDWVIFYSPKLEFNKPEKLQCFTALGQLTDENIYQHDMEDGFVPFRRNIQFFPSDEVLILPLINDLTFIKDKTHWGAPFRFGVLPIPEQDFQLIASQMLHDKNLVKA